MSAANLPEYGPGALVLYTALALVTLCVAVHWRRAGRRAREMAARDRAHADALTCDAIITAAYTRGHEHGRVSGRRIGYDAGHADGQLRRVVQARRARYGGRLAHLNPPPGFNDSEGDEG